MFMTTENSRNVFSIVHDNRKLAERVFCCLRHFGDSMPGKDKAGEGIVSGRYKGKQRTAAAGKEKCPEDLL